MHNYNLYTLKTLPEFISLYQQLSESEYNQLKQEILHRSYYVPVYTWNDIIIKGIEAYGIFCKYRIPFRMKCLHFTCKEEVISWICTQQLKQEDITSGNKKYLIGKKYDAEKTLITRQLCVAGKTHSSGGNRALKKISEECNISQATVYKYTNYSHALDIINEKVPDLVKRIRTDQLWISHANIVEISILPKEQLLNLNEYLLSGQINHLSYQDMKRELGWNHYTTLVPEKKISVPAIRNLPEYDPDAETTSLTLTIPSWTSSIERVLNVTDFKKVSSIAQTKLKQQLLQLSCTINRTLKILEEK